MSGIASVALAVWVVFFPPFDIYGARTVLWVAIIACLLLASYRVWAKERDAREREATRLEVENQQKVSVLQSEIDKLKADKLTFELDVPRSKVAVHGDPDEFNLILHLHICFHNSDSTPRTVRSVNILLVKRNQDNTESEIPLRERKVYSKLVENDLPVDDLWDHRNIPVMPGEMTLYHAIQGHLAVSGDYRQILDENCFLRVTMQAMNQKLLALDFNVKWENINLGWIEIAPRR